MDTIVVDSVEEAIEFFVRVTGGDVETKETEPLTGRGRPHEAHAVHASDAHAR